MARSARWLLGLAPNRSFSGIVSYDNDCITCLRKEYRRTVAACPGSNAVVGRDQQTVYRGTSGVQTTARAIEPVDKAVLSFLIDGGLHFDRRKLEELADSKDFGELVDKLKPTPLYSKIGKDLEQFKDERSLTRLINVLDRYFLDITKRFAYTSPISILPVMDFFVRKELEVRNIRAIVRGKSSGLSEQIIQDMLVV